MKLPLVAAKVTVPVPVLIALPEFKVMLPTVVPVKLPLLTQNLPRLVKAGMLP